MVEGRKTGEIIVEFRQIGGSVKVSAVDPATLTEVSIVGPAGASRAELERAVLQKLAYVLHRKKA